MPDTPIRMHISSSYKERNTIVTNNPVTRLYGPVLVPVVDGTPSDESGQQHVATLLVTAITQRVERLCPVTTIEPVAMSDVEAGLKNLLRQGVQQIVLVPWCLQDATAV